MTMSGTDKFIALCEDGAMRHAAPFNTKADADEWVEWGHVCTASKAHAIVPANYLPHVARFVSELLVTDTVVYEVVGATRTTMKLRRTRDAGKGVRDPLCDVGGDGWDVRLTPQESDPDGSVVSVRIRKDGTYRTHASSNPLRTCRTHDGAPVRRTDYRF